MPLPETTTTAETITVTAAGDLYHIKKNNYTITIKIKMEKGTVKFLNESKGFGFIKRSNGDGDIFVHVSECLEEIRENDEVVFNVKE